jgi:hypothetical protein
MCLLCDDEKAYQAYMNYLDTMQRQDKTADPHKAIEAVLDQLEAADKARLTTRRYLRFFAARSINDRFDVADARRGQEWARTKVIYLA